jgi:hypothetical protein
LGDGPHRDLLHVGFGDWGLVAVVAGFLPGPRGGFFVVVAPVGRRDALKFADFPAEFAVGDAFPDGRFLRRFLLDDDAESPEERVNIALVVGDDDEGAAVLADLEDERPHQLARQLAVFAAAAGRRRELVEDGELRRLVVLERVAVLLQPLFERGVGGSLGV